MEYTYFDINDYILPILRLHKNPTIRDNYLKKIFEIEIKNISNLKKNDIITIIKNHLEETGEVDGNIWRQYPYQETFRLRVVKITKRGKKYVKYFNWNDHTIYENIKHFCKKIKDKILYKKVYYFSEQDNYDSAELDKKIALLENYFGITKNDIK